MLVKLSSKGQLVIPKEIRQSLGLKSGDILDVEVENQRIVLKPAYTLEKRLAALHALYGSYTGEHDLIADLEAEHRREIERDEERIARHVGYHGGDQGGTTSRIKSSQYAG